MKHVILLFSILLFALSGVQAQNYRLEGGIMLGASNILGDIGGNALPRRDFIADLKIQATAASGGLYGRYAVSPRSHVGLFFNYLSLNGADSLSTNPGRAERNLSFRNRVFDVSTVFDYEFYEQYNAGRSRRYRVDFAAYGSLGVGFFFHNPQAAIGQNGFISSDGSIDLSPGTWVDLAPLQTEGVGYSTTGIAIIIGGGFDFTIDRNIRVGLRFALRSTNTDYLDDISADYIDPASFPNTAEGELARELAYRGDELRPAKVQNYREGQEFQNGSNVRGNMDRDDDYFTANITVGYVLKGKGQKYNRAFHSGYQRQGGKRKKIGRFNL